MARPWPMNNGHCKPVDWINESRHQTIPCLSPFSLAEETKVGILTTSHCFVKLSEIYVPLAVTSEPIPFYICWHHQDMAFKPTAWYTLVSFRFGPAIAREQSALGLIMLQRCPTARKADDFPKLFIDYRQHKFIVYCCPLQHSKFQVAQSSYFRVLS